MVGTSAGPDALLLDSGGVLVLPDAELLALTAAESGIAVTPRRAIEAIHRADRDQHYAPDNGTTFAARWARAVGCELEPSVHLWEVALPRVPVSRFWSVANPDAVAFLRELPRHIPRLVVSNSDGCAHAELVDCGLRSSVDGVLDSSHVGIRKPDLRILAMGALAANVDLAACLYVSDNLDAPVDPAVRHVLYDPFSVYEDDPGLAVDRRISTLRDLLPVFRGAR
jgi:putative hydrolase of the HAD superfamily